MNLPSDGSAPPPPAPAPHEQRTRTSVVVVGAGPAGLTVACLLRAAGVDCVLLEAESREFVENRPRAGFVEEWAVHALDRHGLAGRLRERAQTQHDSEFRLDGERHVFPYAGLSGHRHYVYPQPLLVSDLIRAYADEAGGEARFGVADVTLHGLDTPRPVVRYLDRTTGQRHRVDCDFVAGCDGARGVTRDAVPAGRLRVLRHDLGVRWLALLAQAPPSAGRVVFGLHPDGFAAHMARGPRMTRYYLQCPPGEGPGDWPQERVWDALHTRLYAKDAEPLTEGGIVESTVLHLHNYVVEPMTYGRLHLAGDAAQLLAPVGAKGMNLALHQALLLGDALTAYYVRGDAGKLAGYGEACAYRVWQYHEFTQWLSEVFHGPSSGDPYRAQLSRARVHRLTRSRQAGAPVAALYTGNVPDEQDAPAGR